MVNRITEVARKRGVSNARIALAWVAQQPGITAPIFGASKPGHLEDDVAALEIKLDDSELKALTEPYQPHRASDFRARVIPDAERGGAEKRNRRHVHFIPEAEIQGKFRRDLPGVAVHPKSGSLSAA